ncbi:MAG: hypothetical protein H5U40_16835, partial [Polyangiaceae bacterium]|nr:hypothetical protein [Polyangiaceae bacterium]
DLIGEAEANWKLPIARVFEKLISASPLTALLHPALVETFRIGASEVAVLSDPGLRRAVIRSLRSASEGALARYATAVISPELAMLPAEARATVARVFAELGAEDAIDRDPASTLDSMTRSQANLHVLAGLFVAGLDATGLAYDLSPRDREAVESRADSVRRELPSDALARAYRIVGRVDESRSIPLEDAT